MNSKFDSVKQSLERNLRKIDLRQLFFAIRISVLKFQPRFNPGRYVVGEFTIHFRDRLSLYSELKDIFLKRIYHFYSSKKGPLIIDGGSFIGASIIYFKSIYPNAKILAFEPDKLALSYLYKNIKANQLKGVTVHEVGLHNTTGLKSFIPSGTDNGKLDLDGSVRVKVDKLSRFISGPIDYLKLNIEGAEADVLIDLDRSNKLKQIDQLCIEWHSFPERTQNLDKVLSILRKNSFKYLINHFDYESNRILKPPFRYSPDKPYYLLVYAKNIGINRAR